MNFLWLFLSFLPIALLKSECTRKPDMFLAEPINTEINEGENGILNCNFKKDPDVKNCIWFKDSNQTDINGSYGFIGNPNDGNCSIQIMNSTVIRDDGHWICVLSSSSTSPCTRSRYAKYTVLLKPQILSLKMRYDAVPMTNGSQTGLHRSKISTQIIECQSEGGNPAARLTWKFSTFQPHQRNYHIHNYSIGIRGINLTAVSVLRFFHVNEALYGQNVYCVAEHQLQSQSVYITITNPSESCCTFLENTSAYLTIGAVSLLLIGVGFGALLLHLYQKRNAKKHAKIGKKHECERIENKLINVNKNEERSLKHEPVVYTSLACPKQTKPDVSQQSTQNELCYAELDLKVLNNGQKRN